jgi:CRISPR-associated protein Cas1
MQTTSISTPTAHLVGPGKLKVINGRLAFATGQGTPGRLDPKRLDNVLCYGSVGITDEALTMLCLNHVQVCWMSPGGAKFRGRLSAAGNDGTMLRILQHRALADAGAKRLLAREVVCEKIQSQLDTARHYQRHGARAARVFIKQAKGYLKQARKVDDLERLRGLEGITSKAWFDVFAALLKSPWTFPGRVRRPPTDPVNALLSLGYTFLTNRAIARIQAAGLELNLGALHEYRPGRPSLACDLIEPLRAPVVDRWVLQLCNRKSVTPADFTNDPQLGVRLQPDRFGAVLAGWERWWLDNQSRGTLEKHVSAFVARLREVSPG